MLKLATWSATSTLCVLVEQGHPREGLATHGAVVLFHFGVCLQVRAQVGAVCEGPVAVLARERLLSGVGANVSLQ